MDAPKFKVGDRVALRDFAGDSPAVWDPYTAWDASGAKVRLAPGMVGTVYDFWPGPNPRVRFDAFPGGRANVRCQILVRLADMRFGNEEEY